MRRAFSLVELSVVLVILGLLVGGVLAGQSLIQGSKVRSQLKQLEEFDLAASTFKLQYDALPGDLPEAGKVGLYAPTAYPCHTICGNGDGFIWDNYYAYSEAGQYHHGEVMIFWRHLSEAKLLPQNYTDDATWGGTTSEAGLGRSYPISKIDPGMGIGVWTGGQFFGVDGRTTYYSLSQVNCGLMGDYGCSENRFTPEIAEAIDRKRDDGKPLGGLVQAREASLSGGPNVALSGTKADGSATSCITSTSAATARYTASTTAPACGLTVQVGF